MHTYCHTSSILLQQLPSLLAIIGTIIGVVLGSYLTRKANEGQWLKKTRRDVFHDFLVTLNQCQNSIYELADEQKDKKFKNLRKAYFPLLAQRDAVALLLREDDRKKFTILINKTVGAHSWWLEHLIDGKDYPKVYEEFKDLLDQIQTIFHHTLNSNKW